MDVIAIKSLEAVYTPERNEKDKGSDAPIRMDLKGPLFLTQDRIYYSVHAISTERTLRGISL